MSDFLSALRPMVRSGAAQLVAVVVTTATRVPLERHVFEFGLADAAATASALASAGSHPAPAGAADAEALQLLERLLGETLATLGAADAWLRPLPPGALRVLCAHLCTVLTRVRRTDCTFQLMAHTTDRGADADVYWVTKDVLTEGGIGAIGPHTVPVHSLGERQQAPLLRVQVMVEQAQPQEQQAQLHDPWDMHGACASDDDAAGGADFMS